MIKENDMLFLKIFNAYGEQPLKRFNHMYICIGATGEVCHFVVCTSKLLRNALKVGTDNIMLVKNILPELNTDTETKIITSSVFTIPANFLNDDMRIKENSLQENDFKKLLNSVKFTRQYEIKNTGDFASAHEKLKERITNQKEELASLKELYNSIPLEDRLIFNGMLQRVLDHLKSKEQNHKKKQQKIRKSRIKYKKFKNQMYK